MVQQARMTLKLAKHAYLRFVPVWRPSMIYPFFYLNGPKMLNLPHNMGHLSEFYCLNVVGNWYKKMVIQESQESSSVKRTLLCLWISPCLHPFCSDWIFLDPTTYFHLIIRFTRIYIAWRKKKKMIMHRCVWWVRETSFLCWVCWYGAHVFFSRSFIWIRNVHATP